MKLHKIESHKLTSYMFKKSLVDAGFMCISILVLAILISVFVGSISVPLIIMAHIWPYILLFLMVIFMFSFLSRNVVSSKRYAIGNDFFYEGLDDSKVSMMSNYTLNKLERRSGQKRSQRIFFNDVKKIDIKKDKIVIKSFGYSIWNGNGAITIPAEVDDYESLVRTTKEIMNRVRTINRK